MKLTEPKLPGCLWEAVEDSQGAAQPNAYREVDD